MQLSKESGAAGGRKSSRKGIPNRSTAEVREAFKTLVETSLPDMQNWLSEVAEKDPAKAITLVTKLAQFVIPKLQAVELKTDIDYESLILLPRKEKTARIAEIKKELSKEKQ